MPERSRSAPGGGDMRRRPPLGRFIVLVVLAAAVVAVPAASVPHDNTRIPYQLIEHLSQGVVANYWVANPDQAPSRIRASLQAIADAPDRTNSSNSNFCASPANRDTFNCDVFGLPQNEESVSTCPTNTDLVLGGTNDYRGLIDPQGNFTGWHWSTDGGHTIRNEGLLPPVTLLSSAEREVPSGGDPVKFIAPGCDAVYAASLAYNPENPFGDANGIAVYKSTPEVLSTCEPFLADGTTNPACWPVRRLVAESVAGEFLDKPWMFVGVQAGVRYVWVTYTTFDIDPNAPLGFTGAEIHAVRCDENLVTCLEPIPISEANGPDLDTQFSDVTVGPDGRAYITWSEIVGELPDDPDCEPAPPCEQTFIHKLRVETAPGTAVFGPERIVFVENRAIPFGGFLHANDFRIATYPKNDVVTVRGNPRIFVIWDACKVRLLGFSCEEPEIKLSYSDDEGVTWTGPIVLSNGGDNYFPTITADRAGGNGLAAAWFTNYYDNDFHNRQDVMATSINSLTGQARGLKRVTVSANETEADPLLGGFFIGDYIEAVLAKNRLYVHWNANYRKVPLLGGFLNAPDQPVIPVNQQDNYLTITGIAG
jgi:hypothetical protein